MTAELPTFYIRRRELDSFSAKVPYGWRWVVSGIDHAVFDTARKVWILPASGVETLRWRCSLIGIQVVDVTERVNSVIGGGRHG